MLTIKEIKFNDKMILNNGKFILVELEPVFHEAEGATRKRQGTKAVVALTNHRLEKVNVLITETIACSPFNDLELAEVSFSDFEGWFIQDEMGHYVFQAKASQLHLEKG